VFAFILIVGIIHCRTYQKPRQSHIAADSDLDLSVNNSKIYAPTKNYTKINYILMMCPGGVVFFLSVCETGYGNSSG